MTRTGYYKEWKGRRDDRGKVVDEEARGKPRLIWEGDLEKAGVNRDEFVATRGEHRGSLHRNQKRKQWPPSRKEMSERRELSKWIVLTFAKPDPTHVR